MIRVGVADRRPLAVDGPVGRLADDLGLAVAVEVVDHELRVVGAFADVLPEVDPPEEAAVELVGFELRFARPPGLRVVASPHLLFQDDLVLAVAVEVADRGVVGGMAGEGLEGDRRCRAEPGRWPGGGTAALGLPFPAVLHRPDEIGEGFLRVRATCRRSSSRS